MPRPSALLYRGDDKGLSARAGVGSQPQLVEDALDLNGVAVEAQVRRVDPQSQADELRQVKDGHVDLAFALLALLTLFAHGHRRRA